MSFTTIEYLRNKLGGFFKRHDDRYRADAVAYTCWMLSQDGDTTPAGEPAFEWDGDYIKAVQYEACTVEIPHYNWRPTVTIICRLAKSTFTATVHCPRVFARVMKKLPKDRKPRKAKKARSMKQDQNPGPLLTHNRLRSKPFRLRLIVNTEGLAA